MTNKSLENKLKETQAIEEIDQVLSGKITNSEIFENGWISELEIAKQIVKQSDPEFRDCVTNLWDYSDDDMDWNRINYNLDMYRLVQENKKLEFVQLFKYFQF